MKGQIAFYGSTPAYRPVLDLHGWGDLQPELNALSKRGDWTTMGGLIDDELLDALAVVAPPGQVGARVEERFGDLVDRFGFYTPYTVGPDRCPRAAGRLHELTRRGRASASDDDVDEPRRPDDDPLRLAAGQRLSDLGGGEGERPGLLLADRRVDVEALPDLPVDLDDEGDGLFRHQRRVERRPTLRVDGRLVGVPLLP